MRNGTRPAGRCGHQRYVPNITADSSNSYHEHLDRIRTTPNECIQVQRNLRVLIVRL